MRTDVYRKLGGDPLARLRRLRGQNEIPEDRLRGALGRVFKGEDGRILLDYMILHSYGRVVAADAPDSALREVEARKKFLDQILALAEEPRASQTKPPPTSS